MFSSNILCLNATAIVAGRMPALPTKISQRALAKNLRHIRHLKRKLQDKYKIIGRDKRTSPVTERNIYTKASQPPQKPPTQPLLTRFLYSQKNLSPNSIVFRNIQANLNAAKISQQADATSSREETTSSIRMPKIETRIEEIQSDSKTKLRYVNLC